MRLDLVILLVSLMFLPAIASASGSKSCARRVVIEFPQVHAPMEIESSRVPIESMQLVVPVDCATEAVLMPRDALEATDFLDEMLPIRFKSLLIRGDKVDWNFDNEYGASLILDLSEYVRTAWGLEEHHSICVETRKLGSPLNCVTSLLYLLRSRYRGEEWMIPEDPF